ncbi:MAG: tagaturonate epimerase family protein [Phycisphaerales bacterium]
MNLGKYSFGVGDRFGHQGRAQLAALIEAKRQGVDIVPVWNKSNREHSIIGTRPADVRNAADAAVKACGWKGPYFVDADHIGLDNVDGFIEASDFFTLDVADFTGKPAQPADIDSFVAAQRALLGSHRIDGIADPVELDESRLRSIAAKYLFAVRQAGEIFRHVEARKGPGTFMTEVSMDETDAPQTPVELLVILAASADEGIPAETIAPKFSGRFNKGVDYVGDVSRFAVEFEQDLAVIRFAVERFCLPYTLKLSIHSGSDKFSIYGAIGDAIRRFDAGLHLKTAGTTWLEELIGLALAGGEGLAIAQEVYSKSLARIDELCGPYATVIDIDRKKLPAHGEVCKWNGEQFAAALRHDPACPAYNPNLRQLLHVGYKVAAEMGPHFLTALEQYESTIAENVTTNLYDRHIRPVFLKT